MPTDHYLSWALDTEADDVHEVFLSGIHPSLVDDDLALCVKLERVAATVQDAPRGTRESPEKVRLGVCSDDDGDDEEFLDAVRGQCLADGVLFRHDASLWADGGDEAPADAEATPTPLQTAGCGAPLSEVRLPELERLSMDVVDESDENGIGIDAGCLGICEEPSEMRESGSDVSEMCQGRGLEPMDCVPGGSSSPGCYLAPEAVEEVVVSLTTPLETSPGSEGCTSVLDQASEDHLALVDNGRGDAPREEVCRRDSFSAESPAGEISSGESSHKNVVTHELCQEDPSQEDLLQEDSLLEGPSLQGPAPADLSQVDSSQKGPLPENPPYEDPFVEGSLLQEPLPEGSLPPDPLPEDPSPKHSARGDPLLGDPALEAPFLVDPPLDQSFLEDSSLKHPFQEDSSFGGPLMEYPFLGDPLLDPPSLGHPLLEGPSYFEASAFHGPALGGHFPEDISLEDCPLEDDSDDGCASEDSTSEDDSPGETSLDGSSLESSLLDDDSLETPSLYDASPHSQSPGSSSGEDLSQDEFRENLPVQGPSLVKVSASPVPSLSLAMSSPFCLAPVYGTTCTPVYFMLLPDGKTPSGISAEKAVTSPAPSCDPRPTPLPSQPAPSGNAWDTMRELVPLAGRRQSVRRRPSLRCGPPQRTYEGIARRASVAAPWKKQQVATRTVPEHWYGAGKKLSQPWKETVSLLRTPAKTGASARNSADVAATKGRWMRRRPTKADVPPMPKKMNRCGRCEVCSKTYKRLDKHMLVHLQLRPHECLVCGRRFTQSEHLKRHQQKHAETMDPLRQCKCTECGKVLSRRDKLKDHLSHAHGIKSKPAVCD